MIRIIPESGWELFGPVAFLYKDHVVVAIMREKIFHGILTKEDVLEAKRTTLFK